MIDIKVPDNHVFSVAVPQERNCDGHHTHKIVIAYTWEPLGNHRVDGLPSAGNGILPVEALAPARGRSSAV